MDSIAEQLAKDNGWNAKDVMVEITGREPVLQDGHYSVDFPPRLTIQIPREDFEFHPAIDAIRPGAQVRVKPSVENPNGGWGGVSHDSVGQVDIVRFDGSLVVRFPELRDWKGVLSEIELIQSPGEAMGLDGLPPAMPLQRQLSEGGKSLLGTLDGSSSFAPAARAPQPTGAAEAASAPHDPNAPMSLQSSAGADIPPALLEWFSEMNLKPTTLHKIEPILDDLGADTPEEMSFALQEEDGAEFIERLQAALPPGKRRTFKAKLATIGADAPSVRAAPPAAPAPPSFPVTFPLEPLGPPSLYRRKST